MGVRWYPQGELKKNRVPNKRVLKLRFPFTKKIVLNSWFFNHEKLWIYSYVFINIKSFIFKLLTITIVT